MKDQKLLPAHEPKMMTIEQIEERVLSAATQAYDRFMRDETPPIIIDYIDGITPTKPGLQGGGGGLC